MCSDDTNVNVAAYNLAKEDLGEHYLLILCPAHKLELAVRTLLRHQISMKRSKKIYMIYFIFFVKPTWNGV